MDPEDLNYIATVLKEWNVVKSSTTPELEVEKLLRKAPYDEIKYVLIRRGCEPVLLHPKNLKDINIMPTDETIVFFHGFKNNATSRFPMDPIEAILNHNPRKINLLVIDWSYWTETWYYFSAKNAIKLVSNGAGEFLATLRGLNKICSGKLVLAGFSLGAHGAALTARRYFELTGEKAARVDMLDQAGFFIPGVFEETSDLQGLPSDAYFTQCIVTSNGLGWGATKAPCGMYNVYPNNCETADLTYEDAHRLAVPIYTVAIRHPERVKATLANSWDEYLDGFHDRRVQFGPSVSPFYHGKAYLRFKLPNLRLQKDNTEEIHAMTAGVIAALAPDVPEPMVIDPDTDLTAPSPPPIPPHDTEQSSNEVVATSSVTEFTFSDAVEHYVQAIIKDGAKPNLLDKFRIVFQTSCNEGIRELWETVSVMAASVPTNLESSLTPIGKRNRPEVKISFVTAAKKFLERCYLDGILREVCEQNPELGETPSVATILELYINSITRIAHPTESALPLEQGAEGSGPIWLTAYVYLRCGKAEEVIEFMRRNADIDMLNAFLEYTKLQQDTNVLSLGLPSEIESRIQLQYAQLLDSNSSIDPYKKLIYTILSGCDVSNKHSSIIKTLDDCMWVKLCQVREDSANIASENEKLTYVQLQDYVVKGFSFNNTYENARLYAFTLVLTGQFETALATLFRFVELKEQAVHMAILLHEYGLLITSEIDSPTLTECSATDPHGTQRLNYGYILNNFSVTIFEEGNYTKMRDVVNYLFIIEKSNPPTKDSWFARLLSTLAIHGNSVWILFGEEGEDGRLKLGLLEKMGISTAQLMPICAALAVNYGLWAEAIILYVRAGKLGPVFCILIELMAKGLQTSNRNAVSNCLRLKTVTLSIYDRYKAEASAMQVGGTLKSLTDIITVKEEFDNGKYQEAMTIIEAMELLPFSHEEVTASVTKFGQLSEPVRMNIKHLILTALICLQSKFLRLAQQGGEIDEIQRKFNALNEYCRQIGAYLSPEINSKIVEFEGMLVKISSGV